MKKILFYEWIFLSGCADFTNYVLYSYVPHKFYYDFQTGHMKTSMGSYFIKPTEHWREGDKDSLGSSLQHAIYRVPTAAINLNDDSNYEASENGIKNRNCGVIGK